MKLPTSRVGLVLLAGLIACGPKQALHTESSTAAIRTAEEVGASNVPKASLHLQLAREEMAMATELHDDGKKEEASSMLLRAEADAELAIALSNASAEKTEAEAAVERVRKLRAENPYSPGGAK
jgi:hypothetical protein